MQVNGSIGRASVSKTEGWGFESLLTCHFYRKEIVMNLFQKVKMEYSKVEWPSRTEVIHSTIWVVTMTVIISIYLGVFDILAVRALNFLEALI